MNKYERRDWMRVKMCGMRTITAARAAEEAGADYIGFIFVKNSRRYIAPEAAREIVRALHRVRTVGVFVDAPMSDVNAIAGLVGLDYVQLHGHETAEMAKESQYPVIKAYRYGDDFDADTANAYPAEMILVDSYVQGAAGGTGTAFHWQEAARRRMSVKPQRSFSRSVWMCRAGLRRTERSPRRKSESLWKWYEKSARVCFGVSFGIIAQHHHI